MRLPNKYNLILGIANLVCAFIPPLDMINYLNLGIGLFCLTVWYKVEKSNE